MKIKFTRNHWILIALMVVLTGEIAHYVWAHWGLVTVHAKKQPLSKVIRSIEKQGHAKIRTNMDLSRTVDMDVDEVTIAEALETLAARTEARWRLFYYLAPDTAKLNTALASVSGSSRVEGWQRFYVPLPPIGDEPPVLLDPRKDTWTVKVPSNPTLHGYLDQGSKNVSAIFEVPEGYNPPVKSAPSSGTIKSVVATLASRTGAKYEEVFELQGSTRTAEESNRDGRDRGEESDMRFAGNFGGDRGPGGGGFDRSAMEERIQNEIAKLPPAERAAAEQEHNERRQFFDSLRDLTPEDRAKMFGQMMNDPRMQGRMDDASASRDSRRSPEQKAQRAQQYLQRAAAARNGSGGR
jgi:hypothetical protein